MIIENFDTREQWDRVVIHLKRSEAGELRDALNAILLSEKANRHEHVPSVDFQREITLLLTDD